MKKIFCYILGLSLTCWFSTTFSWNALGHMVVATIAYDHLQPSVKTKVDQLVADFNKVYPEVKTFYQLAAWPDTLHGQKIETYSHWHYTNLPFSDDGTPLKNVSPTDNVIWALSLIKPVIQNTKANKFERARFLGFFAHFVGDIHQPLHTTSRISAELPNGDEGGNLFYIQHPSLTTQSISLHKYWDQGLGLLDVASSFYNISLISNDISQKFPEDFFGSRVLNFNFKSWGAEGFDLAQEYVYVTPPNQVPTSQYVKSGIGIIEQRLALAGYRLAAMLNIILANTYKS